MSIAAHNVRDGMLRVLLLVNMKRKCWPMKTFVCSYWYKGAKYGFEIQAETFEDAQAIFSRATVDGILMATIKVPTFMERILGWMGWK